MENMPFGQFLEQRLAWCEIRLHAYSIGLGDAIHKRMERDADQIERITGRRPDWSNKPGLTPVNRANYSRLGG